jgi:hypothetical protein
MNESLSKAEEKPKNKRELIYSDEFKKLINENPDALKNFLEIEKEIKSKMDAGSLKPGEIFERSDVIVEIMSGVRLYEPLKRPGYYLKVGLAGQRFFVKRVGGYFKHKLGYGAKEFLSTQKVKELLLGIENVEVVDFQLGYQDPKRDVTYFVSKWIDCVVLCDHIIEIRREIMKSDDEDLKKEYRNILVTIEIIRQKLEELFHDFGTTNMLYDSKNKKIIVYDLHLKAPLEE